MRRILFALTLIMSVLLATPVAVATGGSQQCDFNNDGYDDAAIGVGGEDVGAESNAGAVNVLYGSVDGLTSIGDQLWFQDSPGIADTSEAGDRFGISLECGDFNNDGYADLVIAAPLEGVGAFGSAGAIHLLFGSAQGLTATDSLFMHRDIPGVAGQAGAGDDWGWSLAVGDFNGDGRDDLAVGSPFDDVDGVFDAGSIQVFYGFAGGLSTSNDKVWHRGTAGIKGELIADANFGRALTVGDFDGNGYDDVAIGAPGDTIDGNGSAGSVSIIYGSASGLTKAGDDLFHRDSKGIRGSAQASDFFARALAAGDFDMDGDDELAIGVPNDDIGSNANAGSVHIMEGGPNGLKTGGDKIWHRNSSGIRGTASSSDQFGYSLAAGRFNGGGHYDLAIGVRLDDVGLISNTGSVHVLYGTASGLSGADDQIWHQDKKGINGTNESSDQFGFSVSTGDFDGNNRYDLLIGIPFEDGLATTDNGKVEVIYGKTAKLKAAGDQSWSQESPGIEGAIESGDQFGRNVNGLTN